MMFSLVTFLIPTLGRHISPAFGVPVELLVIVALFLRARRKKHDTRPYSAALIAFLGALAALVLVMVMVALPTAAGRLWLVLFG